MENRFKISREQRIKNLSEDITNNKKNKKKEEDIVSNENFEEWDFDLNSNTETGICKKKKII